MNLSLFLLVFLQGVVFVGIAPLVLGVLRWARAALQRRHAYPWFQVYLDLFKLMRKRPVIPEDASFLHTLAPSAAFIVCAMLGFCVPVLFLMERGAGTADLVLIIGLLGLAHLAQALAGMDTGAPFGALGSSREMFMHMLAEPILLVIIAAFAVRCHTTDLVRIIQINRGQSFEGLVLNITLGLISLAFLLVALAETGLKPFSDSSSHLELSMSGKAAALDYSGPQLAMLEWTDALRLTFFMLVGFNVLFPWLLPDIDKFDLGQIFLLGLFPVKLLLMAVLIAIWEASQIKLRLRLVIQPLGVALVFAVLGVMTAVWMG